MLYPKWVSQPTQILYQGFWAALDWLYPPFCAGCGKPGTLWCDECQNASNPISLNSICVHCGQVLPKEQRICAVCRKNPPPYTAMRSWATFSGPLRKAVHSLKYQQNMGLGIKLADHLISLLDQLNWSLDFITPVPLNSSRLAERGYNQSNLLARPIAFARQLPFVPGSINRTRNTASQVGLSATDRLENVTGAFEANRKIVDHKSVLLVDDVATTGATLAACTQALLSAGAEKVYAITLARAIFKNSDSGGV
ncbi:MAG: ComF family protein [Anaerolineaceae bacterium]|nr:ComF family protein [Anaerolineaceae bacterium]